MNNEEFEGWGDCNKCGHTETVHPKTEVCEFCGCRDPYKDYPSEAAQGADK